jgi:CheY-like chemotaxis protein/signal transduction histidine kinase/HAMP domain-containing protein
MKETDKKDFIDYNEANQWERLKYSLRTWRNIGVGKSLFIWFLAISFFPLAVVSFINFLNAYQGLTIVAIKSLNSSSQLRLKYIYTFFDDASDYLSINSTSQQKEKQFIKLADAYHLSKMSPEKFVQSGEWKKITKSIKEEIEPSLKLQRFYDLIFMDPHGDILFRTKPDNDLGENVFQGRLSNTLFAATARKSMEENKMLFSDLAHYAPSLGIISGFFTIPVWSDNHIIGIMALQISVSSINNMIQQEAGYGKTGEAFLIGSDMLLRSSTRFGSEKDILKDKIVNKKTQDWVDYLQHRDDKAYLKANELDEEKVTTYDANGKGNYVLGIYRNLTKIEKYGIHWALIEQISHSEAFAYARKLSKMVKISFLITILVVIFISILVTRWFVNPIKQLSSWGKKISSGHLIEKDVKAPQNEIGEMKDTFNKLVNVLISYADVAKLVAKGDFSETVQERSDEDVLAKSINQMVESFRSVVDQADRIAEGDFNTMIKPRSDSDALGKALYKMTETLRKNAEKFRNEDWVKTGLNELDGVLKGKSDVRELSNAIISFFSDYLGAQVGLIYLYNEEEDVLKLSATYAIPSDKENILPDCKPGEGMVGQVFVDGKRIVISHKDAKLPLVDLGLGKKVPQELAIVPFSFENQVVGVMEIGSVNAFTSLQLQFIDLAVQDLALAIITLNSHVKMRELLAQTQEQAKILEVQQEELRQTNEELQEQTEALKHSEENLQTQQEELKVTNEELEERTKALEIQRDAIKKKNIEIEEARKEIEKKAADLEQASRYKSEFLANMSHELRTPLNSIIVLSQLLDENKNKHLSEKEQEFARTINSSGVDLLNLINDILDLSKVEAGKIELNIEPMYLQDIAEYVENNFGPVLERKGLKLIKEITKEAPEYIETDIQRVQQVIKNLISNAIKFTEEGNITFKVGVEKDAAMISKLGLQAAELVTMTVSDTGIGIPKEQQQLIFEAFNQADGTTSRKYGGTGLGLSISKSFAFLLGGAIYLDSEVDKGSSFTLYLPLVYQVPEEKEGEEKKYEEEPIDETKEKTPVAEGKNVPEAGARKPVAAPIPHDDRDNLSGKDKVILIIEDDQSFAGVLLNLSHEHGYKGIIAPDGETGLYFTDYYQPDAIILDMGLPKMDGKEVIDQLKDNLKTRPIPVHVISARNFDMDLMRKGAIGYLIKPVTKEQLDKAFNKIQESVSKPLKKLLIVEDEKITRKSLEKLLEDNSLEITSVETGEEALEHLSKEDFDCMILDLGLEGMSGFEVLKEMQKDSPMQVPVVIYTSHELTEEENSNLKKYAKSIVLKGAHSFERLLDETTLFLHQVDTDFNAEKKKMLEKVHGSGNILKDKTILIVDDDMRNVFALSSLLETYEMNVVVGRNGRVGIEKLKANDQIDLVLMDIMMPEMDGYEAMRLIRKEKKYEKLPIIALTAKALKDDREKCLEAGANEYLSKPVEKEKLISLLRVWLYK